MRPRNLVGIAVGLMLTCGSAPVGAQEYRTYAEIGQFLLDAEANYPAICQRHDLGQSVQGRHIWALCITDNLGVEEDEPEFRYISTMHGDEWVGNEMCLYLIDYLTSNYGTDPRVTNIVDQVELWIVPLMNPDGYDRASPTRYNAKGVDLNRDFPCPFTSPDNTPMGRAPETIAIMNWCFTRSFTLAANMHTGALVVNYPFDANESGSYVYTPTPDDDMFVWISEEYSQHNSPMWNGSFYHGITNGADWYVIYGGMQDWSYRYMGCNEVTIELSNTKIPPASQIPQFWDDNRESMLAYVETCLIGVRGLVTDAGIAQPLLATITVVGRDHEVYTDPEVGDYHRMLLPGTYDLAFETAGYDPLPVNNVVVSSGPATRLDVDLWRTTVTYPNGGETLTAGTSVAITWTGNPAAQYHVQFTENADDLQVETDGFESGSLDPAYSIGGDADWFVTTSSSHSGSYSARAGSISHDQESWLARTVGGGEISFWYRVSSEADYDWFNFYINGERELHRSGTVNWTQYSTTLPEGNYELKWEYRKDESLSSGSDTVWIDDLEITVDNTSWTDIVALTDPGATFTQWTPENPGSEYKVRARTYYAGGYYGCWDQSDETFTVLGGPDCPGDLDGDGYRNATDFTLFAMAYGSQLGQPEYNPDADLDGDGFVNLTDFSIFADYYLVPCP